CFVLHRSAAAQLGQHGVRYPRRTVGPAIEPLAHDTKHAEEYERHDGKLDHTHGTAPAYGTGGDDLRVATPRGAHHCRFSQPRPGSLPVLPHGYVRTGPGPELLPKCVAAGLPIRWRFSTTIGDDSN